MSKKNTNSLQNDTFENQYYLNYSFFLEIGLFKHSGKIGKLKDDNNCVLSNESEKFQENLLKNVLDNEKKDEKNNAKGLVIEKLIKRKDGKIEK